MKIIPKIDDYAPAHAQPTPDKLYLGAIRPMQAVDDGCTDQDEIHYYGPVGGLQLTYALMRDPADGEPFGFYEEDVGLWRINDWYYSDIFVVTPPMPTPEVKP